MANRDVPEVAGLHLPARKASKTSMAWTPSPRNFESPRNNLEAAHDSLQVDRHVQNLAALMADISPREPTPLDVDLRIESLEGMLIDVAVLVESFIGNEDATRRLLEMHGRIEQCIMLHKLLQNDFSAAASAIAQEQEENTLITSSAKLSRKRAKRQMKRERKERPKTPEILHPKPQRRTSHDIVDAAFMRRKTRVDQYRQKASLPSKKEFPEELPSHEPPARAASVGAGLLRTNRLVPPSPPPPTPEELAAAADIELTAVMRMASPTDEEQVSLLTEVSRRLSSETDPETENESISSEDDKQKLMEKIRTRLMDMASSPRSSRRKDDSSHMSKSCSGSPRRHHRKREPPSPRTAPSMELIRVKSDSVLASSVEIRARLDELIDTLRSPESSPRGSPVRRMGSPGRGAPLWSENRLRPKLASPRRLHTSSSVPSSPRVRHSSSELDIVTVNCRICWEATPLMLCHQIEECGDTYCVQCLRMYCNTKIDEGQVLVINCPEPKCTGELTPNDLLHLVDPAMFRRYQQFHMLATLNINPNCRWCPRPGCNTGVIANPDQRKLECTTCGTEICFECKSFWHEGKECEENAPDERFAEFMKEVDAKQCPSCENFIERSKGCNVMKCSICSHKFCWLCLQPFTVDHFDTEGPCKGKWGVSKAEMALIYTLAGGMIVASAAVAIPSMVLGAPIYGTYRVGKWVRKGRKKEKRKRKRSKDSRGKDP